jgi:hypothetical protein
LHLRHPSGFFELLFAGLALRLLALGVGESSSAFLKHLLVFFVHVDWIRAARFGFGVWVDFTRAKAAGVCLVNISVLTLSLV